VRLDTDARANAVMRALLLTQILPYPPDIGPAIKTWHVLKYLRERDRPVDVTLVSFVRGDRPSDVAALSQYCSAVHTVRIRRSPIRDMAALARSVPLARPWLVVRDDVRRMHALVGQIGRSNTFDVAHADQLTMCQYAAAVPARVRLFDAHNAMWLLCRRLEATLPSGPRRWLMSREWPLLKTYEGEICRSFEAVTAVSHPDRAALIEAAGTPRAIDVVPCTVDTREVSPSTDGREASLVVHLGTMLWPPNVDAVSWFASRIWPLVRARCGAARFVIAGAKPPRSIRGLSIGAPGVEVHGYLPDAAPLLARAGVFVAPLRTGSGMRVKILTAMAHGVPVVTTSVGCEGIQVVSGRHLLIADAPEEFADAVLRLMDDRALAGALAREARALVERTYDYRVALRPLDRLYGPA
jgi:glycosyltransferase involved in cell wall biosynthesis